MPAKRSEYNRSGSLTRLRNERYATGAFPHRRIQDDVCASPQTRRRFVEALQVRMDGIERTVVNEIPVVVAYIEPFFLLLERDFILFNFLIGIAEQPSKA